MIYWMVYGKLYDTNIPQVLTLYYFSFCYVALSFIHGLSIPLVWIGTEGGGKLYDTNIPQVLTLYFFSFCYVALRFIHGLSIPLV